MGDFIDPATFELAPGEIKEVSITATASSDVPNGSFTGDAAVYSSPIWFLFPNEFMIVLADTLPAASVMILDTLSGVIFAIVTVIFIVGVAAIMEKLRNIEINISWQFAPRIFIRRKFSKQLVLYCKRIKKGISHRVGWINSIDIAEVDKKSLLMASVVVIPLLLLLKSDILAMVVGSLLVGLVAYCLKCKLRRGIVMVSLLASVLCIGYMILESNYYIFLSGRPVLQSLTLTLGALGVFFLTLAALLIPLSLFTWYLAHTLRNLKEQKDPLLMLEGRCDL